MLVAENTVFVVGDHGFTKAKLIPSVTLPVDIPGNATASFYKRTVNVFLKEAAFQPYSSLRHAAEPAEFLTTDQDVVLKAILAVLADDGPDCRIQISIQCLFLKHDLDYIVGIQGAPYQSYRKYGWRG